jgi:hypothetical protein
MRRHTVLNAFILVALTSAAFAAPVHLRCEYLENPLGLDKAAPRLSWQSDNLERDWRQSAYEILVASSVGRLHTGNADIWDSGKISSGISAAILLESPGMGRARANIRVGGTRLVGDGPSSRHGLEGQLDSLEKPRQ